MKSLITKSDFVRYLECPLYAWLWKNRPELREGHQNSKITDQGNEVEKIAHRLFDEGKEAQGNYEDAEKHTQELMKGDIGVIYQATALSDRYLARADILKRDKAGQWHLFEVKSSTKKKSEHIADLCFQLHAFRKTGLEPSSINLVLVNSDYIYDEFKGLEADKFFKIEDLTNEIHEKLGEFKLQIEEAYKILTSDAEPKVPALKNSFKYDLPQKFAEYYYRDIPDYSIYDISGIRKNNLEKLTAMDIKTIDQVPDDFFSSEGQNLQVQLTKQKTAFVDEVAIKKELGQLEYPLYFLDYETINPAIPLFDKTKPHQQLPFQYSLHVLDEPGAKVRHLDFLHAEKTSPIPLFLKALMSHIGDVGTVLSWNAPFEARCNTTMAETCPEYKAFISSVNGRMYDLMQIFKDEYQDYRFKGSASIKSILPVLAPELDYKSLDIQHGGMAMDAILDLIEGTAKDREKMIKDLKTYCERDTWAMVRIFEILSSLL